MSIDTTGRPRFETLASASHGIDGCAWGVWGEDDELGTFNDVGQAEVLAAVATVTQGAVFALNWDMYMPSPALYSRGPLVHKLQDDGFGMDDSYDGFFPQASSQWDALSHFAHPQHRYYGGRSSDQLKGAEARNGIQNLARRGIVGRFVLADVDRWRREQGRPIDHTSRDVITLDELRACLESQGSVLRLGDILLVRYGWITWYEQLSDADRERLGDPATSWDISCAGLESGRQAPEWLWDSGVVAVAADNFSFEASPFDPLGETLHAQLLSLLGMPIGEMWALDALAEHCASDGRYEGLLASAPLNLAGGVGSTANAVAIK